MEIKYSAPSKFTPGEFGTVWKVVHENGKEDFYIQISEEKDIYNWIPAGELLCVVFGPLLVKPDFSPSLINLYLEKQPKEEILSQIASLFSNI